MSKSFSKLAMASFVALSCCLAAQANASTPPAPTATSAENTPQYRRTAPAGAPNVVLILLDDVGFGASSVVGGPVNTPVLQELAGQGLLYNRFHTTAICSPTRASLLTGRNPHAVGNGAVMNSSDDRPGYAGFRDRDTATIAMLLQENGYATGAFGKWHQTPDWEISPAGPFERWPTGEGFDQFYGFHGGETDQFEPTLYQGTTPIMRPAKDDYHLTEDLADRAVNWVRNIQASAPDKPFFMYFSTGGIHAPIQVPKPWIEKYRGQFNQGWDRLREESFARQKKMGVIPANTRLTPRPDALPAWDSLSADEKKFSSRLMESYAAFLEHTDVQIGKLVAELKSNGQFDNTLFVYVVGDNGASGEGGLNGSLDYMGALTGFTPKPDEKAFARIDEIGSASTYAHINTGWAWATNTPFQWTKTIASHLGGTRNALVVSWPEKIKEKGGIRSQFGHVNDIMPTILEAAGIEAPDSFRGVKQRPLNGTSLLYSFNNAKAEERHDTQYFEVFGHRAIYHKGWLASAFHHRYPWQAFVLEQKDMNADQWQLFDLRNDFSQSRDLSAQNPEKLEQLKQLFMAEAAANRLLPLKGQQLSKGNLPDPSYGRTKAVYRSGTLGIPEVSLPRLAGQSWSISADIDYSDHGTGVIAALGGADAGMSLFVDDQGAARFVYKLFDVKTAMLAAPAPLAAGKNHVKVDFQADGPGITKGGKLSLWINGALVGEDVLPATAHQFSIHETFAVGLDSGAPVTAYPQGNPLGFPNRNFTIDAVTIETRKPD